MPAGNEHVYPLEDRLRLVRESRQYSEVGGQELQVPVAVPEQVPAPDISMAVTRR